MTRPPDPEREPPRRPRAKSTESAETPTRVLDAAEALFVEKGFAATSMRAIATRAHTNLAAAHYHFGGKEALLAAVIHRRAAPINAARLRNLDALEASPEPISTRAILEAFLEPVAGGAFALPRIIARIYGEPTELATPLIQREFGHVGERFIRALARALPDIPIRDLHWRFHHTIGAMIHSLAMPDPHSLTTPALPGEAARQLLAFALAGIAAPSPAPNALSEVAP